MEGLIWLWVALGATLALGVLIGWSESRRLRHPMSDKDLMREMVDRKLVTLSDH